MGKRRSRRELLALLADYAAAKRARLQVVFDGAPEAHYPEGSAHRGVKISYSRAGSNADARIKEMIVAARNPRELIVITSDRALAGQARAAGARHIGAAQFLNQIDELLQARAQQPEKPVEKGELNDWLRYFGCAHDEER